MRSCFLIIVFSLFASLAHGQVWQDTESWSPAWEKTYQQWVAANWGPRIFADAKMPNGKDNPFHGFKADCADTVYSMRLIFSYENHLPFVIRDPTNPGAIISNQIQKFNHISDPALRARAFQRYIAGIVSTHSLPFDTYAAPISKRTVVPGGLMRTVQSNHHSWTIQNILPIGVPHLVFGSNVSRWTGIVLYESSGWPNPYWLFEGNHTPSSGAGIRYWRPAEYINRPENEVPGFSNEQFEMPLATWSKTVTRRLATSAESPTAQLKRLLENACRGYQTRVKTVEEGLENLKRTSGCYDYSTYDLFSTPNRDRRIFDDTMELRTVFKQLLADGETENIEPTLLRQLYKIFPMISETARSERDKMERQEVTPDSVCPVTYGENKTIDFAEAKRRLFAGMMSNNPLDDVQFRWGEVRGPSERAKQCPSWDPWAPNFGDNQIFGRVALTREVEFENIHFTLPDGSRRRLQIRVDDSSNGKMKEAILFAVDSEGLPEVISRMKNPSRQQIESMMVGSKIDFSERRELVNYLNGKKEVLIWHNDQIFEISYY